MWLPSLFLGIQIEFYTGLEQNVITINPATCLQSKYMYPVLTTFSGHHAFVCHTKKKEG